MKEQPCNSNKTTNKWSSSLMFKCILTKKSPLRAYFGGNLWSLISIYFYQVNMRSSIQPSRNSGCNNEFKPFATIFTYTLIIKFLLEMHNFIQYLYSSAFLIFTSKPMPWFSFGIFFCRLFSVVHATGHTPAPSPFWKLQQPCT